MLLQFSSQVIKHGFLISLRNAQVAVAIGYSPFIAVALTTRSIRQSRLSSSSSKGWRMRQHKDYFTLFAKASCLKSRAAYKLLEINEKYQILKPGQTVVDLGYAPGSWSQVAVDCTNPNGKVIGIDVIPARPPKGVSTIQGNFLSLCVQREVKKFLREFGQGREQRDLTTAAPLASEDMTAQVKVVEAETTECENRSGRDTRKISKDKLVDVVLSDMSEPWPQTDGLWKRSLSDPYYRMMNVSGIGSRDHAGSMNLCNSALHFVFETLNAGGHFICKFYQGSEDKALELRLKCLFRKVYREKPESSRRESKEAYFVALSRQAEVRLDDMLNVARRHGSSPRGNTDK